MSSDDSEPDLTQEIFDAYGRVLVENYCIIASSALLFADTLMTLTSEVQRIWRRKFTGATAVFLVTRYVAVAERIVLLVSVFLPTVQDEVSADTVEVDFSQLTLSDSTYAFTVRAVSPFYAWMTHSQISATLCSECF
ncbi:hypothetical protein VTO73DRAFT_10603 [Trametes versicolor]